MEEKCFLPDYSDLSEDILEITRKYKKIAIVGASANPERPSYLVMKYLIEQGFEVLPVNPVRDEILGRRVYPSLSDIPEDLKPEVVIVFRRSELVLPVVEEIIKLRPKPKVIWMQEGIANKEAKDLAERHGIEVVMNKCFKKVHMMAKKEMKTG